MVKMLSRGSKGDDVLWVQEALAELGYDPGPIDGTFGEKTELAVIAFQGDYDLDMDGVVGEDTMAALEDPDDLDADEEEDEDFDDEDEDFDDEESEVLIILGGKVWKQGASGQQVAFLQELLDELGYEVDIDGEFGPQTLEAVQSFQADYDLDMDGVVGPKTIEALEEALEEDDEDDEDY